MRAYNRHFFNSDGKTMQVESFAKMRALQSAHTSTNQGFVDHLLSGPQGDEIRTGLKLKRLQFDTAPALYEDVEQICGLLDCSKREFLQMAITEAVDKAKATFFATYEETAGAPFGEAA